MGAASKYLPKRPAEEEPVSTGAASKYLPKPAAPEKMGAGEAAVLGGAQGASFGTADELTGVAAGIFESAPIRALRKATGIMEPYEQPEQATTREGKPIGKAPEKVVPESFGEAYDAGRDSARADLEQARNDQPVAAYGAEVVTSIANPVKIGPAGTSSKALGRIAQGAGRAAAEGAVYSAGASTADTGAGVLKDTLKGGGVGVIAGAAGGAAAEGVRKLAGGRVERLEKRILNEFAEGDGGSRPANLTNRRKLERAQDPIVKEVVHGPDGKVVRAAASSPPAEAIEKLQPIIDRVGAQADAGYDAFEAAGRATVDTAEYGAQLHQALMSAKGLKAKRGIEKILNDYQELVDRNQGAPLSLRELRDFTTEIQDIHESVLGVTPTAAAKLKGQMAAVATRAMDDMMDVNAAGDPALQKAAQSIRESNERMHALLTVRNVKRTQLGGEATGKSLLVRAGERASNAIAGGGMGVGAALAGGRDVEDMVKAGLAGAAVGAISKAPGAIARSIDRGITTRAIEAARTGTSGDKGGAAAGVSRAVIQALARLTMGKATEEEARAAGASDQDIRMAQRAAARRARQDQE